MNTNKQKSSNPVFQPRRKRPASVTLLGMLVLSFTAFYWLRFYEAAASWKTLTTRLPESIPLYLLLSGFLWGLAGVILFQGLWRGTGWAPKWTQIVITGFIIYYWLDRLLLANRHIWQPRTSFIIGLCLLVISLMLWSLNNKGSKLFFEKTANGNDQPLSQHIRMEKP